MGKESPATSIRDLGLGAALVSCGFELLGTERSESGRTYFVFTRTVELERAVSSYWADTLRVNARKFSDNIKMLKSRIYGER